MDRGRAELAAPSTTWTLYFDRLMAEFVLRSSRATDAVRIDLQVDRATRVVARFYERIGDHAVNIGERVRYMLTGWLPEHTRGRGALSRRRT